MKIELVRADIAQEETDAIVNAANSGLYAGVDNLCDAIHQAAGPELEEACMEFPHIIRDSESGGIVIQEAEGDDFIRDHITGALQYVNPPPRVLSERITIRQRCPAGSCVITEAFDLPAQYIIHAVGPPSSKATDTYKTELFHLVHQRIIKMADMFKIRTLSLPAISTGIFDFSKGKSASMAIRALKEAGSVSKVELVRITVIDDAHYKAFENALVAKSS